MFTADERDFLKADAEAEILAYEPFPIELRMPLSFILAAAIES